MLDTWSLRGCHVFEGTRPGESSRIWQDFFKQRVTNDAEFQVETWADLTERDRGAKCTKDNELVASPRSSSKNSEESKEMILTGLRIIFS